MECRFRHKCWSWKIEQIRKKISLLSVLFKSDVWFQIVFLFKFKYWSASLRFLLSKHVTKGWYECQKTKTFILIRHFIILIITGAHDLQLRMFFVWHSALLKGKHFFKINHIWSNPTQFCEDAAMLSFKRIFLIKAMPWNVKSPNPAGMEQWVTGKKLPFFGVRDFYMVEGKISSEFPSASGYTEIERITGSKDEVVHLTVLLEVALFLHVSGQRFL